MRKKINTAGEIEFFIQLLHNASSDLKIKNTLLDIVSKSSQDRQRLIQIWVTDLLTQDDIPLHFIEAISYLHDDEIASIVLDKINK